MDPRRVWLSENFRLSDFPERWRQVPGQPGYIVSTLGRVARVGRGRLSHVRYVMAGWIKNGYHKVRLRTHGESKEYFVSNLVALAFLGPRLEGMDVLHYSGVSTNDKLSNLYYGTKQQNMADKLRHGTQPLGEGSHLAKRSLATVLEVKASLGRGEPQAEIARRLGVPRKWVSDIKCGVSWRHV